MDTDSNPMVSVVMPAYNAAKTIQQSIGSVIAQTYQGWELLVIVDASNDMTVKIIEDIAEKDGRVRLHVNERRTSAAYARNIGVANAQGKWIAMTVGTDSNWKNKLSLIKKQARAFHIPVRPTSTKQALFQIIFYMPSGSFHIRNY